MKVQDGGGEGELGELPVFLVHPKTAGAIPSGCHAPAAYRRPDGSSEGKRRPADELGGSFASPPCLSYFGNPVSGTSLEIRAPPSHSMTEPVTKPFATT